MGDHTDYNDGFVPADGDRPRVRRHACRAIRIDRAPRVLVDELAGSGRRARSTAATTRATSSRRGAASSRARCGCSPSARRVGPRRRPRHVTSTVPVGSGLSSSSALAVALTLALADLGGLAARPASTRRGSRSTAEVAATGVPGGLMDQLAALFGRAGHALLIDCRSTRDRPGADRARRSRCSSCTAGSPARSPAARTRSRRAECEAVAAAARPRRRCATRRSSRSRDDPTRASRRHRERARARHRGGAARPATCARSARCCSRATPASATTTRCRRRSSTARRLLVESGAAGARLTGAGFGGCVVALAQRNHADDVLAKTTPATAPRPGSSPTRLRRHAPSTARGASP